MPKTVKISHLCGTRMSLPPWNGSKEKRKLIELGMMQMRMQTSDMVVFKIISRNFWEGPPLRKKEWRLKNYSGRRSS